MRLPESIRDVIGRRLSRLSAGAQLLSAASVVGRGSASMRSDGSPISKGRLLEVLEEAVAARVVEEVPQVSGRYRFSPR
jgi:hypothetical protein